MANGQLIQLLNSIGFSHLTRPPSGSAIVRLRKRHLLEIVHPNSTLLASIEPLLSFCHRWSLRLIRLHCSGCESTPGAMTDPARVLGAPYDLPFTLSLLLQEGEEVRGSFDHVTRQSGECCYLNAVRFVAWAIGHGVQESESTIALSDLNMDVCEPIDLRFKSDQLMIVRCEETPCQFDCTHLL